MTLIKVLEEVCAAVQKYFVLNFLIKKYHSSLTHAIPALPCACVQVYDCWHNWLIVWGSRPSSSHNKIRTSSRPRPRPRCLSAVISWSTQINCHLISFPGFVVAEMCGPGRPPGGRGEIEIINFSNVFWSSTWMRERRAGGWRRLKVNLVGCLCN